jgi:hypothetical protein
MCNQQETFLFVGPLNINRQTRQVTTALGAEIALDAKEVAALEILASKEGRFVRFDEIYATVWEGGRCSKATARQKLKNLSWQVNNAGEGFMWLMEHPKGYALVTRWGHNWKEQSKAVVTESNFARYGKRTAKVTGLALVAAASLVLIVTPMLNSSDTGIIIQDGTVPLAAYPLETAAQYESETDNIKVNVPEKTRR